MGLKQGTPFRQKAKNNELTKVICLLEADEDEEYAGLDLKQFYGDIGVKMERFPIKDFKVPQSKPATVEVAKRILSDLRHGERMVIHCAGGSGRTGTILLSLYKLLRIKEPLKKLRSIKSTYVETEEQKNFGNRIDVQSQEIGGPKETRVDVQSQGPPSP